MDCLIVSYIRKHPFIHRCANTERAVGDDPDKEQSDERFPKYDTENARPRIRHDDGCRDIHYRDIEDTVGVGAFSRTPKYILVTTEIERLG